LLGIALPARPARGDTTKQTKGHQFRSGEKLNLRNESSPMRQLRDKGNLAKPNSAESFSGNCAISGSSEEGAMEGRNGKKVREGEVAGR